MPELPEVQTTVNGLNLKVKGRKIVGVKTTYNSPFYVGKKDIKNPKYFNEFKKRVVGMKILRAERRAKNILIHLLNGETIIAHMKMTGSFIYDRPEYPYIRLEFLLDNKKTLFFSDMRKFARVCVEKTDELANSPHLSNLGPEPLETTFGFKDFESRIKSKPKGKIKQVLMDPSVIAGIGNIYSDEILWRASIHPMSLAGKIPEKHLKEMFKAMKQTLEKGIELGGDSNVDYRNIDGERGSFQEHHRAYQQTRKICQKKSCDGVIERMVVGARSAHFCPKHQILFK